MILVKSQLSSTWKLPRWAAIWMTMHYSDVIMSALQSQIAGVSIVCSAVYSGADQGKHQSSAALTFVRGIQRWPVDSAQKGPVLRKIFLFDDAQWILWGCLWPRAYVGRQFWKQGSRGWNFGTSIHYFLSTKSSNRYLTLFFESTLSEAIEIIQWHPT